MATIGKQRIEAKMTLHGGPPASLTQAITAAETFVEGEIVYMSSGKLVEIASDTPAVIYGVSKGGAAALLTAGEDCPVWLADPGTLFAGNVLGAAAANHTLVQADLGRTMGIQRVTADSKVYLDSSVSNVNTRVFTHQVAHGSAVGDVNARVLFSFLQNFYQANSTS